MSDTNCYRVNSRRETDEIIDFYRRHPDLRPTDLVITEAAPERTLSDRHEMIAAMFGDKPELDGELYSEAIAQRDKARKALIEKARLTGDESEIMTSLLDDMTAAEICEYYGIDRNAYLGFVRSIRRKLRDARAS